MTHIQNIFLRMQLHFYVSAQLGAAVRRLAESKGLSVSAYVAALVAREVGGGWPAGYFDGVVGKWRGPPLERESEGEFERRERL
jgi:hypothetical protein